jgi:hypothetical protein
MVNFPGYNEQNPVVMNKISQNMHFLVFLLEKFLKYEDKSLITAKQWLKFCFVHSSLINLLI